MNPALAELVEAVKELKKLERGPVFGGEYLRARDALVRHAVWLVEEIERGNVNEADLKRCAADLKGGRIEA